MNRNSEIMRYQSDKLSYWLCIFGIIFNIVYFVSIYTNRDIVPDAVIGADVLINIIFMMIAFLASEKLKLYEKKWNVYAVLLGLAQIVRVLWLPAHFKNLEMLVGRKYILIVVWLLVSGGALVFAGLNATINSKILSKIDDDARVGG
ncbi:MAG: hypothetical protein AB1Z23_08410 [Eubacteriales bacterium]